MQFWDYIHRLTNMTIS